MKTITYTKDVAKALRRMPANTARTIKAKIEQYATDPASLVNNVNALKGEEGVYRLRVGDWRVLLTESGEILAILKIAPRGDVYE